MTVIRQLKETMTNLKRAQANLEDFALHTDNQQAKQMYEEISSQTQQVIQKLSSRIQEVETAEPQYKS